MRLAIFAAAALLAGCAAPAPQTYWYKAGATTADLDVDHGQCTAQAFQGGASNLYAIVITQDGCMRGKGWQRATR